MSISNRYKMGDEKSKGREKMTKERRKEGDRKSWPQTLEGRGKRDDNRYQKTNVSKRSSKT